TVRDRHPPAVRLIVDPDRVEAATRGTDPGLQPDRRAGRLRHPDPEDLSLALLLAAHAVRPDLARATVVILRAGALRLHPLQEDLGIALRATHQIDLGREVLLPHPRPLVAVMAGLVDLVDPLGVPQQHDPQTGAAALLPPEKRSLHP